MTEVNVTGVGDTTLTVRGDDIVTDGDGDADGDGDGEGEDAALFGDSRLVPFEARMDCLRAKLGVAGPRYKISGA